MTAPQVVSLVVSFAALAFTGLTYRDRRKQDRRDLFLKLHERLVDADLQRGRRLLYSHARTRQEVTELRESHPEQYDLINRSLAMLDVAGMYVDRDYIDKKDFLSLWGPTYGRAWLAAGPFLDERFAGLRSGSRGWPYFRSLGAEAAESLDPPPETTET